MAILSREKRKFERPPDAPNKWPKTPEAYSIQCPIGRGSFAVVHKATCFKEDGPVDVAIKVIDLEKCADSVFDDIRRELTAMRRCHHINVLQFHVAFQNNTTIWMVMPILKAGSAADVMRCQPEKRFSDERVIAYILREVAKALRYFHSEKQMHRDLKAGNILLNPEGEVRLADFGVAAPFSMNMRHSTFVGTPCWMAPEVLSKNQYDEKADVWSFGITAMELLRGEAPYQRLHPLKVVKYIIENQPPHLSHLECSESLSRIVDACLQKHPSTRTPMSSYEKYKFFSKAELEPLRELLRKTPTLENRLSPNYTDFDCDRSQYNVDGRQWEVESPSEWVFDDEFDDFPEEET